VRGTVLARRGEAVNQVQGIRAELESIIETADLIAHDGLQPGSDGFRVMAGLISQLASQTTRLLQMSQSTGGGNDRQEEVRRDTRPEEDVSPEDAPAEPSREV
jgi:hypothetical protein